MKNIDTQHYPISLVGAFDRYNFGDFLFPIVVEHYLKRNIPNSSYNYFGLSKSDFSSIGAVPTKKISDLYKSSSSAIIICGGETLSSNISFMYRCLDNPRLLNKLILLCEKKLGSRISNSFVRKLLQVNQVFPYIINPQKFDNSKVIYNCVGGFLPEDDRDKAIEYLQKASLLTVRDNLTHDTLKGNQIESYTVPDCAVTLREVFSEDFIKNNVSKYIYSKINILGSDYVVFQSVLSTVNHSKETIVKELKELHDATNMKIVLLPIGKANLHLDHLGLNEIQELLPECSYFLNDLTIYDIIFIIMNSKLFIGSSLHGNITAMAYGVPSFGINMKIRKLVNFMKDWGYTDVEQCVEPDGILKLSKKMINYRKEQILNHNQNNIKRVEEHFMKMSNLIMGSGYKL